VQVDERERDIATLLPEAHEAQAGRVLKLVKASSISSSTISFSKTARGGILVGAGAVGRACKLVLSYGIEPEPEVASKFLSKLTLKARHTYNHVHVPKVEPPAICIPQKAVTDAFSGMPKKSAAHRDGWTWELMQDAAQTPSTADLLRKFAELFSNGALPPVLWAYLASTLLYPFHKKLHEDKSPVGDPALRPVTVGLVLTRFGC